MGPAEAAWGGARGRGLAVALLAVALLTGCPKKPVAGPLPPPPPPSPPPSAEVPWSDPVPLVVPDRPAPACAVPEPITTVVRYYDVVGTTWSDVVAYMAAHGPSAKPGGKRWWAYTQYFTRWRYVPLDEGLAVTLSTEIVLKMPRWKRPPGAALSQEAWDTDMKRLLAHELGHVRIAIEAFQCLPEAVKEVETGPEVDAVMRALLEATNLENVRYDVDTGHGKD